MQCSQKRTSNLSTIKTKQLEFFNSVFSYGKLKDSSLTYFLVFVVIYLKIVENIDHKNENNFSHY